MIPFLRSLRLIAFALLHDENKFRRWMRGLVGALAASGAMYADQLEPLSHRLAVVVRVVAWLCMVGVAMHGDTVTAQPAGEPAP